MKNFIKNRVYPYIPKWLTNLMGISKKYEHLRICDIDRVSIIRNAAISDLRSLEYLLKLLPDLGLAGRGMKYPDYLIPFSGRGLHCEQYPIQLAPYLIYLSDKNIKSYCEIGVKWGGTFITTVEYLSKFNPMEYALAVDICYCPTLVRYAKAREGVVFSQISSDSEEFQHHLNKQGNFDLVLIDGDHSETACLRDFYTVRPYAKLIAIHDICNDYIPGPRKAWERIKLEHSREYKFYEFAEQYGSLDTSLNKRVLGMGIAEKINESGIDNPDRLC